MRRTYSWSFWLAFAFLLVAGSAAEAVAQDRGRDGPRSRQDMQERVMREFERRVADELELEPQQAIQLREVLATFRDQRSELARRRGHLRMRIRRHLSEGGEQSSARSMIHAMRELREEELELQKQEDAELLRILSGEQLLRLQLMREEFSERIRRLDAQGGRRGGGSSD